MGHIMVLIWQDADIYGISMFDDNATVRKKALLNILASGVHIPSACIEIVDCSTHLVVGSKKDGKYANCLLHFTKKFEAWHKLLMLQYMLAHKMFRKQLRSWWHYILTEHVIPMNSSDVSRAKKSTSLLGFAALCTSVWQQCHDAFSTCHLPAICQTSQQRLIINWIDSCSWHVK